MTRRNAVRVWAGALMCAVVMMAAGGAGAEAKTLRIGAQADAGTMDPQAQNIQTTITLLSMIYEPLVTRSKSLATEPLLAVSWSQPDPLTWRFRLRPNVTFQDGSPFTAADVAFTIQRAQNPVSQFAAHVAGFKVKVIDDHTVEIATPAPDPLVPQKMIYIPIMSKTWAESHHALVPQNLTTSQESYTALHANGTGPYMLVSRAPDSKTVLTRYKGYWGKTDGDIDEVDYMPIASDPTRIAALISGQLDLVIDVPAQDVARLQQDPDIKIEKVPEFRTIFFGFDLKNDHLKYAETGDRNPFKDLRVRQAMNLAVDRLAIVRTVMRGLASADRADPRPGQCGLRPRARPRASPQRGGSEEAAGRGWLSPGVRVHAGLPERPLHQRRGGVQGLRHHAVADRPEGDAELHAARQVFPEALGTRYLGVHDGFQLAVFRRHVCPADHADDP